MAVQSASLVGEVPVQFQHEQQLESREAEQMASSGTAVHCLSLQLVLQQQNLISNWVCQQPKSNPVKLSKNVKQMYTYCKGNTLQCPDND